MSDILVRPPSNIMAQSSSSAVDPWLSNTYEREVEIGRGAYAKIYKAKELDTNQTLAVKVYNKMASPSEDTRRRQAIRLEVELLTAAQSGVSYCRRV